MKTVESVCKELKGLDGVVGAFVLRQSQCIGSSLPPQYDPNRLAQVGATLARIAQISQKTGYDDCTTAFHWQRASLLTWPIADGMLGILAAPNAVRETVDLSAAMAIEDLSNIITNKSVASLAPTKITKQKLESPANESESAQFDERLRDIERLLVEELGPSGKSLLERCRNRTPRGNTPASTWLLSLRNAILADIVDPGARVTIGTSYYWAEFN